jgi:hypothetical protein
VYFNSDERYSLCITSFHSLRNIQGPAYQLGIEKSGIGKSDQIVEPDLVSSNLHPTAIRPNICSSVGDTESDLKRGKRIVPDYQLIIGLMAQVILLSKVRIVQIALGQSHMLALDDIGKPYAWGDGR